MYKCNHLMLVFWAGYFGLKSRAKIRYLDHEETIQGLFLLVKQTCIFWLFMEYASWFFFFSAAKCFFSSSPCNICVQAVLGMRVSWFSWLLFGITVFAKDFSACSRFEWNYGFLATFITFNFEFSFLDRVKITFNSLVELEN